MSQCRVYLPPFRLTRYSEKYLKKLAGDRDIEDSLERLDKLTQEEARMASAELLKMTQSVNGNVMGVDDRVKGVEGKMQDVRNGVEDVRNHVQGVGDRIQDVDKRVEDLGNDISIRVQSVDEKLDQANRSLLLQHLLIIPHAKTTSQGTSSKTTFYDGYRPRIHPPIITSHVMLVIMVEPNGFFGAACSINGSQPAPSCGYTESVRYIWPSPCVNL